MIDYEKIIREASHVALCKQFQEYCGRDPSDVWSESVASAVMAAISPHLRPADDDEPLTTGWVIEQGFQEFPWLYKRTFVEYTLDLPNYDIEVQFWDDGEVMICAEEVTLPCASTRGALRSFIKLMTPPDLVLIKQEIPQ